MKPAIEQYLQALCDANNGILRPEEVVTAAQDPDSPIHGYFEWDDGKAAHSHRINQARALIRSCRVDITVEKREFKAVAYVSDPRLKKDSGYAATLQIRKDEDAAAKVIYAEFKRAAAALERARTMAHVLGVQEEIDRSMAELNRIAERLPGALDA